MKEKILKLRSDGRTYDEICDVLGCSKSTVAYYCSLTVRNESHRTRVRNKRNSVIELKRKFGGCCSLCGYNKCLTSLSFHHKNPDEKSGTISNIILNRGKRAAWKEDQKCVLVCANCHGEIEENNRGTYNHLK
jgi:5-methylcytosine-specific restriction endonuclease McrA